ncbi:Sodium/solute symporter [Ascosphaera apis ARSEF 7405]|uniref:Sodium/solute symporter n=1 Tax=Ascosphaera apis ARSEF 7405 TaxID=392613 RepID=A0A166PN02_9EURO|nr:Sodium/solute symporter [Ascosphaera apis ARSEF 7405]
MFTTAGRSVKSGLIAAGVVSSWTWAATLLQSSSVAYKYGVSGPLFYACGAGVQIILFATMAIELKRRSPNAHTVLEGIRARYGTITHCVFIVFCLMCNILVSAMLLAGGSAVVNSLTGMNTIAACFLLPVGVVLYTMFGGVKSTLLTDYAHTIILVVLVFIFAFSAYVSGDKLGSTSKVYDLLVQAAIRHPVEGNAEGSYLTVRSREGAIFFVINLVGNFGTVFLDCGYWNKAIAAHPVAAFPGYVLGGLCWFAIPWLCSTTLGLVALALEGPERMATADVTAGLALPFAAVKMLGSGGAAATLLLIFMAVTSAFSAELIAISSLFTYDIYQAYIHPKASGKTLVDQNAIAAALSPVLGLACALIAWLVTTKKQYGVFTVETTGANNPMLAGNVTALLSPLLFSPALTFIFGRQNYDWESMKNIRKVDDSQVIADANVDIEQVPGQVDTTPDDMEEEMKMLKRTSTIARCLTVIVALCLLIIWPMPMYGSSYVFSKPFFRGWIVVGIIWLFGTAAGIIIFPLYEGRKTMATTFRSMWRDITGRRGKVVSGEIQHGSGVDAANVGGDDEYSSTPEKLSKEIDRTSLKE